MGNLHPTAGVDSELDGNNRHLCQPPKPKAPRRSTASEGICVRRRASSAGVRRSKSIQRARSVRRNSRGCTPYKYKHAGAKRREAAAEMERKKIAKEQAQLMEAAARGDAEEVETLIDSGVDVNATDGNQMTALHHAAMHARDETIKALLLRGANPNATDLKGGFSPLHWVVINADPQICSVDHVDASIVALVRAGGDVNCTDFNFATPLHIAAQKNNKVCVDTLIRSGADPKLTDITGRDCLKIAKNDSMRGLIERLARMKDEVVYHVLDVPNDSIHDYHVLDAPDASPQDDYDALTSLPPLPPLPPFRTQQPKKEPVYHILNPPVPTSIDTPPPLPPPRSSQHPRKSPEVFYHVLEVSPTPDSPPPTPPRRRRARFV